MIHIALLMSTLTFNGDIKITTKRIHKKRHCLLSMKNNRLAKIFEVGACLTLYTRMDRQTYIQIKFNSIQIVRVPVSTLLRHI